MRKFIVFGGLLAALALPNVASAQTGVSHTPPGQTTSPVGGNTAGVPQTSPNGDDPADDDTVDIGGRRFGGYQRNGFGGGVIGGRVILGIGYNSGYGGGYGYGGNFYNPAKSQRYAPYPGSAGFGGFRWGYGGKQYFPLGFAPFPGSGYRNRW